MGGFSVLAVGDIILDEPDPASFLAPSREVLARGSVVIDVGRKPYLRLRVRRPARHRAARSSGRDGNGRCRGQSRRGPRAGGVVVRRAHGGGAELQLCRASGVLGDLHQAGVRVPARAHPTTSSTTPARRATRIYTFADPLQLQWLADDVAKARQLADYVIVAYHKGIGHTPAALAMYEGPVSHAAIDAGVDAVVAHHAHIMRGVEVYRGRPIYHGLGNFVTVTRALTPTMTDNAERQDWARRRQQLYGFTPDPDMPAYPFHPESRNTAIAVLREVDGQLAAGLLPCWIDDDARPIPLRRSPEADRVLGYIEAISRKAGFTTQFRWGSDDLVIVEASP